MNSRNDRTQRPEVCGVVARSLVAGGQEALPGEWPWQHPAYIHGGSYPNDVALLKLSTPIALSEYIKTVCLPSSANRFTSQDECWVTGWGDTLGRGNPDVLNKVRVRITGLPECKRKWKDYVHENHICVGDGLAGPCRGDSGGPLVCVKRGRFLLAGVASFGNELCGIRGFPGVFTKVSQFSHWISSYLQH
ncbi:hypothetical protein Ahia01_001254000 [Argonauta hians]